jgi:hypothetical protein
MTNEPLSLQCTNCGEYAGSDIADEIERLREAVQNPPAAAEIDRLREALGAMTIEKHIAEAEAKLWFEKAREWQAIGYTV